MSYAPDESKISAALLGRFLTGECTPEEAGRVRVWVASAPMAAEVVELLAGYRANRVVPEQMVDVDALWQGIQSRVLGDVTVHGSSLDSGVSTRENTARPALQGIGVLGRQPLRGWGWPMAVLVAGVMVTVASWTAGVRHGSRRNAASTSTYTTGNGQRANITLPDGSTVALNVASRLDVPADYVSGHHTVRLVGEALFTVTHHTGTPLTVIAGPAVTQVLGTSFVVRHYPTDPMATVAVRDGKVAVRSIVLTAAQQVEINQTGVVHVGQAEASQFSFATGVLALDGVPLRDAIPMLDRWFDAEVRLGDAALGARQVTGGFTAGSLSDLAESLELTFNVRVVRDGRVLIVYPR